LDLLARLPLLFAAWLGPALCVLVAAWRVRSLGRVRAPRPGDLREQLRRASSPAEREEVRQELRENRRDAERALAMAALWPHSLARVSLATGTALAVAILAQHGESLAERLVPATVAFVGGFAGLTGCAIFGQQAKGLASKLRQGWRDAEETAAREWTQGRGSG
jgi:hypothetical protein